MYVHYSRKLIYLAHPRTASVATSRALQQVGFARPKGIHADHHMRLYAGGSPVGKHNRSQWFVFTTVRNHYDTAVSWLLRKARGATYPIYPDDCTIELFRRALDNNWVKDHSLWWLHKDDADAILRFENIEDDLQQFSKWAGFTAPNLRRENITPGRMGRHYSAFYSEDTKRYIDNRFGEELAHFGYSFEGAT